MIVLLHSIEPPEINLHGRSIRTIIDNNLIEHFYGSACSSPALFIIFARSLSCQVLNSWLSKFELNRADSDGVKILNENPPDISILPGETRAVALNAIRDRELLKLNAKARMAAKMRCKCGARFV